MLWGSDLDADTAWQIAETLDRSRDLTPCVLVLPASAASVFPDAEILDTSASMPQRVSALGTDVLLQRLDAASITQLAAAYRQGSVTSAVKDVSPASLPVTVHCHPTCRLFPKIC